MTPTRERTLSTQLLRPQLLLAVARGIEARALFEGLPLDAEMLDRPDARVPVSVGDAFTLRLIELARDPWLGLHLAEHLQTRDSWLAHLALCSPTFGSALETVVRFSRVFGEGLAFGLRREREHTAITLDLVDRDRRPVEVTRFVLQSWLGLLAHTGRASVVPAITPVEVSFPFPDHDLHEYVRVLGVRPQLDASIGRIAWRSDELARTTATADAALHTVLCGHAQAWLDTRSAHDDSLVERVREHVRLALPEGAPSVQAIALRLAQSTRTLQRGLQAEGMSFSALVDDVRKQLAQRYVDEGAHSLDHTAALLGFSTTSAFSRAFRRWTGSSPSERRSSCASARD
jgi:AraC-like DNA-binding protein